MRYARQILAALVVLGIVVLLVVIIIKGITSSGTSGAKQTELVQYATTNTVATLTIDGPVVAEVDHRTTKIIVGKDAVTADVIQGYGLNVIQHSTFGSSTNGYAIFLQSLKGLGFAKGNNNQSLGDERGSCPFGNRYIYTLTQPTGNVFRYWSTSCGGGTFKGNASQVQQLFKAQIPQAAPAGTLGGL